MKVGSMFSGIGGIDSAFLQAGFEIAWAIDKDADWQKFLNEMNKEGYEDVRAMYQKCYERQKAAG